MAVTVEHERTSDVQCGGPAHYVTEVRGFPICSEHCIAAAREGLTFDLGNSRLSLPAGTTILDRP